MKCVLEFWGYFQEVTLKGNRRPNATAAPPSFLEATGTRSCRLSSHFELGDRRSQTVMTMELLRVLACPLLSPMSGREANFYPIHSTAILLMPLGFLSPEADPNPETLLRHRSSSRDGQERSNTCTHPESSYRVPENTFRTLFTLSLQQPWEVHVLSPMSPVKLPVPTVVSSVVTLPCQTPPILPKNL